MEDETHDNINYKVGEYELYEIYKLGPDEKKWRKHAFESELKIIYHIKRLNDMNHIHDKKVYNIVEWSLLNDMLSPSKQTKNINSHYSSILHVSMNTRKGKLKVMNPIGHWV